MTEDLSFKTFLRHVWKEIKKSKSDPFFLLITETFFNTTIAALLLFFIHPVTVLITAPWFILRIGYWIWRMENE